jgi:hypothetical protein
MQGKATGTRSSALTGRHLAIPWRSVPRFLHLSVWNLLKKWKRMGFAAIIIVEITMVLAMKVDAVNNLGFLVGIDCDWLLGCSFTLEIFAAR